MDWTQFLCGIPSMDYAFQQEPYENQIQAAARYFEEAEYVPVSYTHLTLPTNREV